MRCCSCCCRIPSFEGRAVAGCALWMALWWVFEPAPIPVTSMLPLVLFPLFGMGTMEEVAAPYADTVIFLVLGGVILGLATEKSGLHIRIALLTVRTVGTKRVADRARPHGRIGVHLRMGVQHRHRRHHGAHRGIDHPARTPGG
ncbi:SLC13 family permease [Corynebacterium suedekumii]|nr:SLC13 family permease [Corynebacterium suedekumii]